ncbi:MAG: hypothetical protein C0625_15975 [Arcobacter sp.]|nr:MAG: hypothetical protein C0625_15975 [Arcobacter sp.]
MLKKVLITTSLAILFFTGCSTKEEIAIVNEKGKYGALDNNSNVVIKPVYDELSSFDDRKNKNIKTNHPNVLNLHWLHNYYGDEYAIAEYNGKYGVVNKNNELVIKPIYDSISKLFNGFSVIKLDEKYGFLDDKFEVVQKPIFRDAREFLGNVTFVQSNANGKCGCITKDMDLKINDEYDEVYNLYDGFARTVKDGKWGYINDKCEVVVIPSYDYAYDFSKGFAKVQKNGHIAYINEKGEEITKNIFTSGENF